MKEFSRRQRAENRVVGLVPTMGALHQGHISLIRRARSECSSVVVSIFVNPTQFAPSEDFSKYPRNLQGDTEILEASGVDALFLPDAKEIYPTDYSTYVTVEGLSDRVEGRLRPGHFRGVSTIVLKLLQIVQPNFAYFGRKDAQQAAIISRMAADLNLESEMVVCPIVREPDGLAMSSRNVYLNAEDRRAAAILYRSLLAAKVSFERGVRDAASVQSTVERVLASEPRAKPDYAQVVDANSFQPIATINRDAYVLLAVRFGTTRLLDNLRIKFPVANPEEIQIEV